MVACKGPISQEKQSRNLEVYGAVTLDTLLAASFSAGKLNL